MRELKPRAEGVLCGLLLAAVSGVAIGATFSPHGGALLPFVAFAPLGAALARTGAGRPDRAAPHPGAAPHPAPFALGFATAAIAHAIGLYWMIPALSWRTPLALPIYLAVVCLLGMFAGAACTAAEVLRGRWRWPLPLALAVCWTGSEWAAAHVPGLSYAWLNAGMSLGWSPALAAGSELLGARFLTCWTVAVGAWVGQGCAGWVAAGGAFPRITPRAALALVLAVLPAAAGRIRQAALPTTETVARVAAVQPGRGGGGLAGWLEPIRRAGEAGRFDVAAFPERFLAAVPRDPDGARPAGEEPASGPRGSGRGGPGEPAGAGAALAAFADALGSAVLIGAMDAEVANGGRGDTGAPATDTLWYNAAFLQAPGGDLPPAYRKVRLVPGLEGMGWWPRSAPTFGGAGYTAGRVTRPLVAGDLRVGVMICYDSAFGETARVLARQGANWLAVLSNDDWLDPDREFRVTWAYWQHATHGRLRAIENRISLLQVASTGHTFAVSPDGTAAPIALEPGEAGVAVLEPGRRRAATFFTLTGDLVGPACLLLLAAGLVSARRARQSVDKTPAAFERIFRHRHPPTKESPDRAAPSETPCRHGRALPRHRA